MHRQKHRRKEMVFRYFFISITSSYAVVVYLYLVLFNHKLAVKASIPRSFSPLLRAPQAICGTVPCQPSPPPDGARQKYGDPANPYSGKSIKSRKSGRSRERTGSALEHKNLRLPGLSAKSKVPRAFSIRVPYMKNRI